MPKAQAQRIGISAIAIYVPPWKVGNDWFGDSIPRKFVHQTGIVVRPISTIDEVGMAVRAAESLKRDTHCNWRDCAGVIFSSPSFIPLNVANKYFNAPRVRQERLLCAARRFANQLGIINRPIHALNWFCSGYAKALAMALKPRGLGNGLQRNEFLLVVNSSRISRITDFGCHQTGPLFGDLATVTMLARQDSQVYPPRFNLLFAKAETIATEAAYFSFHLRKNVAAPQRDGGRALAPERLVFSFNGPAIADAAPRAMSAAMTAALQTTGISPDAVKFVVPHQAGTGIVRLASMKIESSGITAEVINGITSEVGNVSSCSIPFALKAKWNQLDGVIACPTAAVGAPGRCEMSRGCILLQAASKQDRASRAA